MHADPQVSTAPLLIVVEGVHDVRCLRHLSALLHRTDPGLPDLGRLADESNVVFAPVGGGNACEWARRFAPLRLREFHLFDRESLPATSAERERAAEIVNQRPGCHAVVMPRRSLENYLHPAAIRDVFGIDVQFGIHDDVPNLVSRALLQQGGRTVQSLPASARKRYRDRVKRRLNTVAAAAMTPDRVVESDPAGELRSWLRIIDSLRNPLVHCGLAFSRRQ